MKSIKKFLEDDIINFLEDAHKNNFVAKESLRDDQFALFGGRNYEQEISSALEVGDLQNCDLIFNECKQAYMNLAIDSPQRDSLKSQLLKIHSMVEAFVKNKKTFSGKFDFAMNDLSLDKILDDAKEVVKDVDKNVKKANYVSENENYDSSTIDSNSKQTINSRDTIIKSDNIQFAENNALTKKVVTLQEIEQSNKPVEVVLKSSQREYGDDDSNISASVSTDNNFQNKTSLIDETKKGIGKLHQFDDVKNNGIKNIDDSNIKSNDNSRNIDLSSTELTDTTAIGEFSIDDVSPKKRDFILLGDIDSKLMDIKKCLLNDDSNGAKTLYIKVCHMASRLIYYKKHKKYIHYSLAKIGNYIVHLEKKIAQEKLISKKKNDTIKKQNKNSITAEIRNIRERKILEEKKTEMLEQKRVLEYAQISKIHNDNNSKFERNDNLYNNINKKNTFEKNKKINQLKGMKKGVLAFTADEDVMYMDALDAIGSKDKKVALKLLLNLIKKHPKNVALKIRMVQSLEL